jgi:osmoprotectant transport system ATP-binding protein
VRPDPHPAKLSEAAGIGPSAAEKTPDLAMIRLDAVTKDNGSSAVGPVTLEVMARRTVALVGPSGAGKSTLLRMAVGLVSPDSGQVFVGGERMTPASAARLRLRIGYVIQEGGLFPHLSARDNATIVARHIGWSADRIDRRLEELAQLLRLRAHVLDGYPALLSGGERQRVALMRALFLDPDVLLLDEPFGALDVLVRSQLQEELRTIVRELDKSALLVTHDLGEASFVAEEIAVLRDGRVVVQGTMPSLLAHTSDPFVARFVSAQRRLAP